MKLLFCVVFGTAYAGDVIVDAHGEIRSASNRQLPLQFDDEAQFDKLNGVFPLVEKNLEREVSTEQKDDSEENVSDSKSTKEDNIARLPKFNYKGPVNQHGKMDDDVAEYPYTKEELIPQVPSDVEMNSVEDLQKWIASPEFEHEAWRLRGLHPEKYLRSHDKIGEADNNILYGHMRPNCTAQKYLAPREDVDDTYWFTVFACMFGGALLLGSLLLCMGFGIMYQYVVYDTTALRKDHRFRHKSKYVLMLIGIFVLPFVVALAVLEYRGFEDYIHGLHAKDVTILTVYDHAGFEDPRHHNWLVRQKYNFFGVDCAGFEYGLFKSAPHSAWSFYPMAAWAIDHIAAEKQVFYWADPTMRPIHDIESKSIKALDAFRADGKLAIYIDKTGGMMMRNTRFVRQLLERGHVMCKSPVEHPYVALMALAVGGKDWYEAVDKIARFHSDGTWELFAMSEKHIIVESDVRLNLVEVDPWC